MRAIRFIAIILLCGSRLFAADPATTLNVKVNTYPNFTGMISLNLLGVSQEYNGEILFVETSKPTAAFTRKLGAATQIMALNNCTLLINAGDQVKLELLPFYNKSALVTGKFRPVCTGKDAARQLLPYLIDSLYASADYSTITNTQQADNFIANISTQVTKLIAAAKVNNAENLAALKTFEQSKQLLFKFNLLDAHKELSHTKELGDWYLKNFDLSAPGLASIGDETLARQMVYLWKNGRKLQDSTITEETELKELLFQCKADKLKERMAIDWIQLEGKNHAFTPDMKTMYPLIKGTLKPHTLATHTIDSLYKSYQQLEPGMPAFNFALENDNGKIVRLSDLKGKVVIVDIWAMWCSSCVASLPTFRKIADSYKDKNDIIFLTIAWEGPESDVRKTLKKFSVDHHIAGENNLFLSADRNDPQAKQFIERYCLTGITRWVAIDQDGNIMDGNLGHPMAEGFEQKIANCYQKRK
ncbi:MAG: TlpA family protein disulfide reductase [Chitinophaga sp.]|uniref:TlpA family protein disulfide reductase n=1 Tax=Chitinophaga sp. TaxID=1869181 RepID=UPI0025BD2375|nr:TlpA disulfide reductase family protein [Chitinophaga sp.]MBV8255540.1 TlpA family protein disulfide reductase [Chitinophaga sp.]